MNTVLGLAELLLVLLCGCGWGAYELWSVRRSRRRPTGREPGGEDGS